MATEPAIPIYLVDAYAEPVAVKVSGRASYTNCAPLSDFFHNLIKNGKHNFIVDLKDCSSLDSTFLGMLAGVAMELRKEESKGTLALDNVEERNLEIIQNLGLHRIITVNPEHLKPSPKLNDRSNDILKSMDESSVANPKLILKAHENLVEIEQANLNKFQDVLSFLKKQIKENKELEGE